MPQMRPNQPTAARRRLPADGGATTSKTGGSGSHAWPRYRMPRELDAYAVDRMAALPKVPALVLALTDDADVEDAALQILGIVESKAPGFIRDRDELFTAITELISNVERHSGVREASVVAQSHMDCVRIAVGDAGRGIRASLATTRRAQIHSLPDHRINLLATEPGVTGSPY